MTNPITEQSNCNVLYTVHTSMYTTGLLIILTLVDSEYSEASVGVHDLGVVLLETLELVSA